MHEEEEVLFVSLQINTPNLNFLNRVLLELSRIGFPIIVLSKDDRTDFAQEEPVDFPHWTMISATCVSVDASKDLDILTSDLFNNDGASSFLAWV